MKNQYLFILILIFAGCSGKRAQQESSGQAIIKDTISTKTETQKPQIGQNAMIFFEGGTFMMGSDSGLPQEGPAHSITVRPFSIDKS
ncbi:MAG TPA: SUMF1/EgtB/PvdO family nonheme iron enzyme, partial [Draconibacterium sp.]|nr:SUMF1/EgtB/PvdO family nonheme iron enzyme [Draconibacterium sp.]